MFDKNKKCILLNNFPIIYILLNTLS